MTPAAPRPCRAGAWRRAWPRALALCGLAALAGGAGAQAVGTLGVDSVDRYRGTGTDSRGPVLRLSAMADSPFAATRGAYLGVAGLWRTRDGGLSSLDALAGWSGRFADWSALQGLGPDWGWDTGVHRRHDGEGTQYDFNEAMLGLLAPGAALRAWWSPHYFGGDASSLYLEANVHRALDEHWRVFGHVGTIRYGRSADGWRNAGRTDTRLGISWTLAACELQLARDALLAGQARADLEPRRRQAAWVLGASFAF